SFAGIAIEIDRSAEGGPQIAAKGVRPGYKEHLEVGIDGLALDAETAPEARGVVVERSEFELRDAQGRGRWWIGHGGQWASRDQACGCPEDCPHQPNPEPSHGPHPFARLKGTILVALHSVHQPQWRHCGAPVAA